LAEWLISHLSIFFGLAAGILISSDLIISKDTATHINKTLRNMLTLSNIKKTFLVAAIIAVIGMAVWVTYLIWKDLQTGSSFNIVWVPVFTGGFIIGLVMQWFLIHGILRLFRKGQDWSIAISSVALGILAIISFITTAHLFYIMLLTLGFFYGVAMLEFSIYATKLLTWFLTTDPNPDPGRNPRVLARIGLLLFIIAGVVELFH
jgi:hypothetical protein